MTPSTTTRSLYSPRLCDPLVRRLYRAAKARGMRMTRLLDEIVAEALPEESAPQPSPVPAATPPPFSP